MRLAGTMIRLATIAMVVMVVCGACSNGDDSV